MAGERAKLLCSFGGDFVSEGGKSYYVGGKTRLVSIERAASFRSVVGKMSELCNVGQDAIDIKFRLPDGGMYDSRLVSVESDDDLRNMMEEFDSSHKIPIFLFTDKTRNKEVDEEDDECGAASIGFSVSEVPSLETELIGTADKDIR